MLYIYMVTFTINIPQMLAYIYIYHNTIHGSYGLQAVCVRESPSERSESPLDLPMPLRFTGQKNGLLKNPPFF